MYRYYPDKAALFAAVMRRDCGRQSEGLFCSAAKDGPLEPLARGVRDPLHQLRADPDRAGHVSQRGGGVRAVSRDRTKRSTPPASTAAARSWRRSWRPRPRGARSRVDDPDLAAHRFFALCLAEVFFKRLFGMVEGYDEAAIAAHARGAVAAFLRMYRPEPDAAGGA